MSTTTTRNSLVKPAYADAADITIINNNMDTIDASFAKCNWASAATPTVNDDSGDGYSVGSLWFDTTAHKLYVAETVGVGSATWRQLYPGGVSPVISASDPTANDDSGDGYAIGQVWFNTTNNRYFVAKDVTLTAAKWMLIGVMNNFGASAAPTANDDIADGYGIGSYWLDTTNNKLYVCKDHAAGNAVWKQVPMTDYAWDIGAVELRSQTLYLDQADGTAPMTVSSKTVTTNLNADMLDGLHDTSFVKQTLADAKGDLIVASAADTWAREAVGTDMYSLVADSSATNGVNWVRALSSNSSNLLINGSFLVNQTGIGTYTSTTVPANNDDTYLIDQWNLLSDGNDIVDVWQANTTFPTARQAAVLLQTETANKKFGIIQFIENKNCRHAIGNYVSLQFKAYTTSANPNANIMAGILSWSSTADALTSDVVSSWEATNTAPTLVANWTYENVPARLALVQDAWTEYKIENVYIDTASTTNIAVFIWLDDTDSTVDDRLYISGVQLNIGSKCVPWVARSFTHELGECKRYYQIWNADAAAYGHLGTGPANDTQYLYYEENHATQWFKTAATIVHGGNWASAGGITIDDFDSESILSKSVIRGNDTGKGFTANHAYIMFANNDTTARVSLESRL